MELLLIRHGLPEHVENRDGKPADPPLSELGRVQARRLSEWLARERIDRLYTSPMARAYQTAEPLAERFGLEPEAADGVAEYDRNASHYIPTEKLKEPRTVPAKGLQTVARKEQLKAMRRERMKD